MEEDAATTLLLVRHGATEWNDQRLAQGHADIELNEEGRQQAAHAAAELADRDVVAVYSSDLQRALETARPIAAAHGLDIVVDADLREINQGEWEGLHVDEIKSRWPELWGPARHYKRRPGGEAPSEVRRRAVEAIRRILRAHPAGTVVVVSHGGTIRWLSAEALGYDDVRSARIRGVGNGAAVELKARLRDGAVEFTGLHRLDGNRPDLDDPND
jgi:broad specificity phosphatase PhoE